MNNEDMPAYPNGRDLSERGLTKREYFVAQALKGLLSDPHLMRGHESLEQKLSDVSVMAIMAADCAIENMEIIKCKKRSVSQRK